MVRRLFSVIVLLLAAVEVSAQLEQRTSVEKSISCNPSIAILSFAGDAGMRAKLEEMLYRSGWFTLASQPAKADIKLQGRGQGTLLEAYVEGLGKSFSTRQNGAGMNEAVYQTVDEILARLFNVRSLCTQKIYFVMTSSNGMKELYSCYLDGTGQERVTFNNAISTEPAWGHRNALVYTLARNNALSIVMADVANQRQRIISSFRGLNSSAALFYDGSRIALPLSMEGQVDLYVMDLRSGKRTRVTQDKNVESSPAWSPDGKQLCYVTDKYGVPMVFMKHLDTGMEQRLTKGGQECVSPDWSPVSNKLCFSMRQAGGQRVLAVIDMAKTPYDIQVVTEGSGNWESPSWGPDGRHVVCIRTTGRNKDLYIVDTWSHDVRPVSKGAKLALPAWRPAF